MQEKDIKLGRKLLAYTAGGVDFGDDPRFAPPVSEKTHGKTDTDVVNLMDAGFTDVERFSNGWLKGYFPTGERFQADVYPEPSAYGIGNGRVSKLYIWDQLVQIFQYERGYEQTDEHPNIEAINQLVNQFCKIIDGKEPIQGGVDIG